MSVGIVGNFSDRLLAVSVRAEPHKGYVTERVRGLSGIVPRLGFKGMAYLVS